MNDIVKQIVVKLRGDTKELEQALSKMNRAVAKDAPQVLQKDYSQRVARDLQKSYGEFKKLGIEIPKSLESVGKASQKVLKETLKTTRQELEKTSKDLERNLKALNAARRTGNQDRISQQERRVQQAHGAAAGSQEEVKNLEQLTGGGGRGINRAAGIQGAILGVQSQLQRGQINAFETNRSARSGLGSELVGRRTDIMEGNLERAFMNATEKMDSRAKAEADRRVSMEGRNQFLGAGMSIAGGAAAGALGGAIFGGVGAVPGALAGAAGGLLKGGSDLYSYYFAGGKQRFAQQQRLQSEQAIKAQSINPYLYSKFQSGAQAEATAGDLLQSDDVRLGLLKEGGFRGRLSPEQMFQASIQNRRFGNQSGMRIAEGAAANYRKLGMSFDVQMGLSGQEAGSGRGSPETAMQKIIEVFRKGVSAGIKDSGQLEALQTVTQAVVQTSDANLDRGSVAQRLLQGVDVNAGNIGRQLEGQAGAQSVFDQRSMGGGLGAYTKIQALTRGLKGQGITPDFMMMNQLMSLSDSELNDPNSEVVRDALLASGVSPDKIGQATSQIQQSQGEARFSQSTMSAQSQPMANEIMRKKKAGIPLSQSEEQFLRNMSGSKDKFTRQAFGRMLVPGQAQADIGDAGLNAQMDANAANQTAASKFIENRFRSAGAADQEVTQNIRGNIDSALSIQEEMDKQTQGAGSRTDLPVEQLAGSLDRLVNAIDMQQSRISSSGGNFSGAQPRGN